MSGKKVSAGVIFTCLEEKRGRGWWHVCQAWGEAIASGPAKTQEEARQKNRDAKTAYLAELEAGNFAQNTEPDPRNEPHGFRGWNRPHIDRSYSSDRELY
jgi:hypothetical protein